MTKIKTYYAVIIQPGVGRWKSLQGWDQVFTVRRDAKEMANRARENDGWSARVVNATTEQAKDFGWISAES